MEINSYIRRRDLHTVLPKHAVSIASNSPRLSKTMLLEEKLDTNINTLLKRPKLNSTSSDSGIVADSDVDTKTKRQKESKRLLNHLQKRRNQILIQFN